eukprot:851690-Prorocentrum_minimum.AAC.1
MVLVRLRMNLLTNALSSTVRSCPACFSSSVASGSRAVSTTRAYRLLNSSKVPRTFGLQKDTIA